MDKGAAVSSEDGAIFAEAISRWQLTPEDEPITTAYSKLLAVRYKGSAAMLKITSACEEQRGTSLMQWWDGQGAVRVLAHEGNALLLERATGTKNLADMARRGQDDETSEIICAVAAKLHAANRKESPPMLVPLTRWFQALEETSVRQRGLFERAAASAKELFSEPREIAILHGDLHHGNVLDAGAGGWLAIDPKGLSGERGFDFANIFCNPDALIATRPGRLARQATIVANAAGLERNRLLKWVLAYAGLSAAWSLEDGDDPSLALAIAELSLNELNNSD